MFGFSKGCLPQLSLFDILTPDDIEILLESDLDDLAKMEFVVEAKRRVKSGQRNEDSECGLSRQNVAISDKSFADVVEALIAVFFLR